MVMNVWQPESHYKYKSVNVQLPSLSLFFFFSAMTDFEIILPNGLHHYLLRMTHHFPPMTERSERISLFFFLFFVTAESSDDDL